jgi:L-aspartate oxidase
VNRPWEAPGKAGGRSFEAPGKAGGRSWEGHADLVVVGSGVAGLTAALSAQAAGLRVLVVSKGDVDDSSTAWAQGGIAVVGAEALAAGDTVEDHVRDTLAAGGGLCDEAAVRSVVAAGGAAVERLVVRGAHFDTNPDGTSARTREGGHSFRRVVHAGGDATGAEVQRALVAATAGAVGRVAATAGAGLAVLERHTATRVLVGPDGSVHGLAVLDEEGATGVLHAPVVLLATGGLGHLYSATTNPEVATGDGVALALAAGALVSDLEFVQFHPTVLFAAGGAGQRPLVTEAVRGEGAVLVDLDGRSVTAGVHPLGDLAPRDVVAGAITARMRAAGTDHVLLDARALTGFAGRFPTVHAACAAVGLDPSTDLVPVAPAAHYSCGGVVTDLHGRTTVVGLLAAGEVARTGLHGANRLASNSLLEGLVLGERAAVVALGRVAEVGRVEAGDPGAPVVATADRAVLQELMTARASLGRDAAGLAHAAGVLSAAPLRTPVDRRGVEDATLTTVARALVAAASARTESRGCHLRTDHPGQREGLRRSTTLRLDPEGTPVLVETVGAAA